MKKVFLIMVVAMMASGMAWAQSWPFPGDPFDPDPDYRGFDTPARAGFLGRVRTDVVPGLLSTEGTNSAGRFTGAADAFMNPRFHNPEIEGTFLFMGGDLPLSGSSPRVDLGFARNFGAFYLGAYFGGGLVNADGFSWQEADGNGGMRFREALWDANLAVLIGIAGMGFRLDFGAVNPTGDYLEYNLRGSAEDDDYDAVGWLRAAATTLALTWGVDMGQLLPWARIGMRFANSEGYTVDGSGAPPRPFPPDSPHVGPTEGETRTTSNAALEIAGGARFLLSDTSAVGGELWFNSTFRRRVRSSFGGTDTDSRIANTGGVAFGLFLYYQQRVDFGPAAIGFRPNLDLGATILNRNQDNDPGESWEVVGLSAFTLQTNIDVGARWQATQRMALFSGITLRLFDWSTMSETGSDSRSGFNHEAEWSVWAFSGVNLANFNLGMTFTAAESIVLGLRLNSLVNGLFGEGSEYGPSFDFTITTMIGGN